jgi:tetratricopeptide (TPR) repeat protein
MRRATVNKFLLALGTPLVLLALAELILALGGWFTPERYLVEVERDGATYVRSNPAYGRLFLNRVDIPMPSPLWVRKDPAPGVRRVVLLGESAAAGFPHDEFNLARLLEHQWLNRFPDQPIEVVNATMVAVNSHILRRMAAECLQLQPDVLILFAGHNEAIGPYGPASVFGRFHAARVLIRFNLWLRSTRVGHALDAAAHRMLGGGKSLPRWSGLEEFARVRVADDDPRLAAMARHADANFRDIVRDATRRGVRVLVAVPPVNLTDWPPLASTESPWSDDEAASLWERGESHRLASAWQLYRLARARDQGGDLAGAWPLYRRALDLDQYRFRADRRVRETLLPLDDGHPPALVRVVDLDRMMHEDNPLFVSDREFFCEHVHFTFAGRAWVTARLAEALGAWDRGAPVTASSAGAPDNLDQLTRQTLFTAMDEAIIARSIRELLSLGVFADQPESEQRQAAIVADLVALNAEIDKQQQVTYIKERYEAAVSLGRRDPMLHAIAGRHFLDVRAHVPAANALQRCLVELPTYANARIALAQTYMAVGKFGMAEEQLAVVEKDAADAPLLLILRGELYARTQRLDLARRDLERAYQQVPGHYNLLVNLGTVYMLQGEERLAMDRFTDCMRLEPNDTVVLNNLAWLMATSAAATPEERAESLLITRRLLILEPDFQRFKAAHALALAANGMLEQALEPARIGLAAIRQMGDEPTARSFLEHLARFGIAPP